MTDKQPRPLELADALDAEVVRTVALDMMHAESATELRRLHAQAEALTAAAKVAVDAYERYRDADDIDALDEAMSALKGQA